MILDKRIEKNVVSITNLKKLLINVIKNPQNYFEDIIFVDSLISQGKLAKYENSELGICGTSINTMKRLSSYPECDFNSLDKLRVSALEKLESRKESLENKTTYNKKDLSIKVTELEQELNLNKSSQLLLLKTINEINNTFKLIKNIDSAEEIKEHLGLMSNKIKKVMSLDSSFLINETNVISHDFRKGE